MTSCRSFRRASLPSLGDTTRALVFRPHAAERCHGRSSGVGHPVSPAGSLSVETTGSPTFLGNPIVLLPCSPTPAGPTHQAMQCAGAAPAVSTTKAPTFVLSRLNHTASALAVYASQAGSPRHHARLASGCWPHSSGRAWLPAGFHRKVSRCILHPSSFPKFNVAQGHNIHLGSLRGFLTERHPCSPNWYCVPGIGPPNGSPNLRKLHTDWQLDYAGHFEWASPLTPLRRWLYWTAT
jgi:hypothetical protein